MEMKRSKYFLLILGLVMGMLLFCGKSPSDAPLPGTGSIKVIAHVDTVMVDSMAVILDNVSRGLQPNGCVVSEIEAGNHQIAVSKHDLESPIDFASTPKLVTVKARETTDVALALTKLAPNFTLKNLNNQDITLANYQGNVVLLVFFSHT
jgi:hypothetical protein